MTSCLRRRKPVVDRTSTDADPEAAPPGFGCGTAAQGETTDDLAPRPGPETVKDEPRRAHLWVPLGSTTRRAEGTEGPSEGSRDRGPQLGGQHLGSRAGGSGRVLGGLQRLETL